jgi:hypothetical protein
MLVASLPFNRLTSSPEREKSALVPRQMEAVKRSLTPDRNDKSNIPDNETGQVAEISTDNLGTYVCQQFADAVRFVRNALVGSFPFNDVVSTPERDKTWLNPIEIEARKSTLTGDGNEK